MESQMFARLGRWCHDRRWIVLVAWVAALVVGGFASSALGTESRSEFALPDVESQRGLEILEDSFGGFGAGQNGTLVIRSDRPVTDPAVQAPLEDLLADVAAIEVETDSGAHPLEVTSPFAPEGATQVAPDPTADGYVAYATIAFPADATFEEATVAGEELRELVVGAEVPGVDAYLGGEILAEFEEPLAELIGLAFAILILIFAFGSVLAMGLPIGVALFGIGVGTTLVGLLSHLVTVPDFATTLGLMIGLGVGIDYALFIVTRYRENLHAGMDEATATAVAIDTSGRAVVFAGTTVVISLLGMLVMQLGFVTGLAVSAAVVVAVTMIGSITLLPALLGFSAGRVEVTRVRGLVAAGLVALALLALGLKAPSSIAVACMLLAGIALLVGSFLPLGMRRVELRSHRSHDETLSYRWSRVVQHHPVISLLIGLAFLVVLALPVFGLRLGFSDEGNYAEGTDTRLAYDTLASAFGPGSNGPLLVAADLPEGTTVDDLAPITAALEADAGVAEGGVIGPIPNDVVDPSLAEPTAVIWRVTPTSAPQDAATTDLVNRIRGDILPAATEGLDIDPAVTGSVAINIDFSSYLADRLLWFFGAVLTLSFILLMVVFRSLLVPLKAVVMNLVSIGAAFGVVVAGFQWGWLGGLLDFDGAPVEPFIPMMLFAIVFGLSMDYEVFLLSRVREEWLRTGDSHESVANGLAATARVITAAALIMVAVFGGFMLENNRVVRLMGTGLATAVLLDATVVRMLLVPATMELLGDRNWWLPRWLDRILPNIDVEGHHDDDSDPDAAGEPERELTPA
jgi:RND superfamily putative drug exporter